MSGKCPKNVSVDFAMGHATKGPWPMAFGGQKPSFMDNEDGKESSLLRMIGGGFFRVLGGVFCLES